MTFYKLFNWIFKFKTNRKNTLNLWTQHIGACIACLTAFSVGTAFGWTSYASTKYLDDNNDFSITKYECSLMESLLMLGAAISCCVTGWVACKIGRKMILLGLVPIFLLGWGCLLWASSVNMLFAGRLFLGICAGATCVAGPMYLVEISQKEIRGTIGSYFQMLLSFGVLFSYLISSKLDIFYCTLICCLVPIIFGILFYFFPDTPVFLLLQNKPDKAKDSLMFFRGKKHNIELELLELTEYCKEELQKKKFSWKSFTTKPAIKGLSISVGLMIFQQINGVNTIIFNAPVIFEQAGTTMNSKYETIIIGVMLLIGNFLAIFLVDKVGRVLLLEISAILMSLFSFLLGLYFYLKENKFEVDEISWLPLLSISSFVIVYSLGFGTIPWMLMSELMPSSIKGSGISIASVCNWLSAFFVIQFYDNLVTKFGRGGTFWIFCVVSLLAIVFANKALPETKGKSFEEIQNQLSGKTSNTSNNNNFL